MLEEKKLGSKNVSVDMVMVGDIEAMSGPSLRA